MSVINISIPVSLTPNQIVPLMDLSRFNLKKGDLDKLTMDATFTDLVSKRIAEIVTQDPDTFDEVDSLVEDKIDDLCRTYGIEAK